eukprot:5081199-Amphidinium_carterae.1
MSQKDLGVRGSVSGGGFRKTGGCPKYASSHVICRREMSVSCNAGLREPEYKMQQMRHYIHAISCSLDTYTTRNA